MYRSLIKRILFLWPAENAHQLATSIFGIINKLPLIARLNTQLFEYEDPGLKKKIWGLDFPNPIGLAAGFDKDGEYYKSMSKLGFGFIELGTVTPLPQKGNPTPRLFRLPRDKALINRMGFNNDGVDAMVKRLKKDRDRELIIGGNIGKNKDTPNEKAISDYDICFNKLYPWVDYFTLNVSSPNTPDLRALQDKEPLGQLLKHITHLRAQQKTYKPVLLKVAPDLSFHQIEDVLSLLDDYSIDGIIASNTTIERSGLITSPSEIHEIGNGGLSGPPLFDRVLEIVKYIRNRRPDLPIIGVGGISSGPDAKKMMDAGADLVQIYTGLIYEGPGLVKRIKKYLSRGG